MRSSRERRVSGIRSKVTSSPLFRPPLPSPPPTLPPSAASRILCEASFSLRPPPPLPLLRLPVFRRPFRARYRGKKCERDLLAFENRAR